jgi:hypothetical protein
LREQKIDCNIVEPKFAEVEADHWAACHLYAPSRPN